MLPHLTHYLSALTVISGLALTYQHTVAVWLQPPEVAQVDIANREKVYQDESLTDLFADTDWQRGACKQLQTSNGMLLFQHWKQTANDEWKLWPITVIIGRGMSPESAQSPVIIEADQGAEIRFTESLDVMSGGAPPIQRGRMIGDVHIYRSDDSDQSQSLDIRTANVGIDKSKIWTTEAIRMSVGKANLVGRDLTIHLSGAAQPLAGVAEPKAAENGTVLDRMELIYLDQLTIPLEKGGAWNQRADAVSNAALVSIACGGRVEYDFAFDQMTLRDSVSLQHQVAGLPADRFDCELLELNLNDPGNDAIQRNSPMDWLIEVVATGNPARATLPSFEVELAAERIKFNAIDGIVEADGDRGIEVRRGGITARLAALIYQFDPARPKVLGVIDAPGAGIITVDDPSIDIHRAQWTERFRMAPAGPATTDDLSSNFDLWVDGGFHAWLADGGEFQAESIEGILKPDPNAKPDARIALVPDRFSFKENVRIDTAAIKAETKHLDLEFIEGQPESAKSGTGSSIAVGNPEGPTTRQWLTQPGQQTTMVDPVARPRPVLRGDLVRAQVWRSQANLSPKNLKITGSVEVAHVLETAGQVLPARLRGEELRLIDGGGEDILLLDGGDNANAVLEIGDGFFIGPQIQVRPKANIVWINAAGEFQMPTAALPTGLAGEENAKMRWTKPPHCRWNGEMLFDGRRASLSQGVDITASLVNGFEPWDLKMTGDELQMDLLEGVEVTDMQTMREATVQRISLIEANNRPVMVEAHQRSPEGVLQAKHLIHAAKLTFAPSGGGQIVGDGPGWYRGWLIPSEDDDPFQARQTKLIDGNKELTGIHLIFTDSMQANLTDRNLEFLRGVRVGVRPVASWDAAFDASKMDAISMGDSTLDCDRLRFTVAPGFDPARRVSGAPTPWEMEAIRGVVFRTRNERGLLEGSASRASYVSAKDLFRIEGGPNRAATFRQTRPDGTPGPNLAARSMSIKPKTMQVESLVFERLNLAVPNNANLSR